MSIKKSKIEDKSIRSNQSDTKQAFNYPGKVTIRANSKKEADEEFKKLNKK